MPAQLEVMYWREIPAGVKARGPFATVRADLPDRFAKAIDQAVQALGIADPEEILAQYYWKAAGDCDDNAANCAQKKARELGKEYPAGRLTAMVELAHDYKHKPPRETSGRTMTVRR